MLFLYRPRQTWMPYRLPRNLTQQGAYNRDMQERYAATRRVPAAVPAPPLDPVGRLKELAQLHESGALTDDEFTAAKAKVLGGTPS